MKFIFDIVHPAHVHFYKHIISGLEARGHETRIVARRKDVTLDLLDELGFEYLSVGESGKKNRFEQFLELVSRNRELLRLIRSFGADVVVTRNPAGVQAARFAGIPGVFDTDDGTAAGIHFYAARPFARWITTPDCFTESYGAKHRPYPGYKQSAYLHPEHFTPDPAVRELLGVDSGEKYYIVRFVSMVASHDNDEAGMAIDTKRKVIERLSEAGRVFISSESALPAEWEAMTFSVPASRLHDALALADGFIGDSQTMACEAAFLGVPNIRVSTFAGRLRCLDELERRYGLTQAFHPSQEGPILNRLEEMLTSTAARAELRSGHERLLEEKVNIADWYVNFLETVA